MQSDPKGTTASRFRNRRWALAQPRRSRTLMRFAIVAFSVLVAGCASVSVVRVADDDFSTPGVRFYRPRPYVVVNKSFPIGGEDFFIYGRIDVRNRVVLVDATTLPDPVKRQFSGIAQYGRVGIPFADIADSIAPPDQGSDAPGALGAHGATPGKGGSTGGKGGGGATPNAPEHSTTQPSSKQTTSASSTQPTTQQSTLRTTSDPTVDPYEKLNDYLGIVYLPDFDQQYAMTTNSGLGVGSASIQMKNAWMADDISWNVDNTQLGQFLYNNIAKFVDLATTVAEQAVAPGSAELAALAQGAMAAHGATPGEESAANITVLLKVSYVVNASPGVYPLLKPTEAGGWTHVRICKEIKGQWADGRQVTQDNTAPARVLLPLTPYTSVAYNYSTQVAIQLVSAVPAATTAPSQADKDDKTKSGDGAPMLLSTIDADIVGPWLDRNLPPELQRDPNQQTPSYDAGAGEVLVKVTLKSGAARPNASTLAADSDALLIKWNQQNPIPKLTAGPLTKFGLTLAAAGG